MNMFGNFSKPLASFSSSLKGTTPPVGLAGELRIISLVLSVINDRSSSASNEKLFSILWGKGMVLAPI